MCVTVLVLCGVAKVYYLVPLGQPWACLGWGSQAACCIMHHAASWCLLQLLGPCGDPFVTHHKHRAQPGTGITVNLMLCKWS